MVQEDFQWPTSSDYDLSMMNPEKMILDEEIRSGHVEKNEGDFGFHDFGGAKLYSVLYKVKPSNGHSTLHSTLADPLYTGWAVRCFCATDKSSPPSDIATRYRHISAFCLVNESKLMPERVKALLPVYYIEKAIKVHYIDEDTNDVTRTEVLPFVKMPYLFAPTLGKFVALNHSKPEVMRRLCVAWLEMARQLEAAKIAHGDLDLTNVLVVEAGRHLVLKLIDYDNMWLESLQGRKQTEGGHDAFQHPLYKRSYDASMDRFSALSIYISLRALHFYPNLYRQLGADDEHQLLFSKNDYLRECGAAFDNSTPNNIESLYKLKKPELMPYLDQLRNSLHNRCMPCALDEVPLPKTEIWYWDEPVPDSVSEDRQPEPQLQSELPALRPQLQSEIPSERTTNTEAQPSLPLPILSRPPVRSRASRSTPQPAPIAARPRQQQQLVSPAQAARQVYRRPTPASRSFITAAYQLLSQLIKQIRDAYQLLSQPAMRIWKITLFVLLVLFIIAVILALYFFTRQASGHAMNVSQVLVLSGGSLWERGNSIY